MSSLKDVTLVTLPLHLEENGELVVIEGYMHLSFPIERVFLVRARNGEVRGQHAHIACIQFLNCPQGRVEVICDDGKEKQSYTLDRPELGLLVPAGIWAQQTYYGDATVLNVICSRKYEKEDYIRDYDDYLKFRQQINGNI